MTVDELRENVAELRRLQDSAALARVELMLDELECPRCKALDSSDTTR